MQVVIALVGVCHSAADRSTYCLLRSSSKTSGCGREIYRLDARLQEQARRPQKSFQLEIDALRNDPKTVERLAREKLGYARSDETVIRFETKKSEATMFPPKKKK